jgi:hypothetical protein
LSYYQVNVDPDIPAERQLQEKVLKKLPEILPIKRSEMSGTLSSTPPLRAHIFIYLFTFFLSTTVPTQLIGQAMGTVKKYAQVSGENYTSGACTMHISIVPGGTPPPSGPHMNGKLIGYVRADYDGFMSDLRNITKGEFTFDVDGQSVATMEEEPGAKGGKGRGGKAARGGGRGRGRGRGGK